METISDSDFIRLAVTGFSVGFGLGFLLWGFCYTFKLFRNTVAKSLAVVDRI